MRFAYPISLDVSGRRCVVVGGTDLAEEKARGLVEAAAHVTVIAEAPTTGMEALSARGELELVRRRYVRGDLKGAFLAIAATGDPGSHREIFEEAEQESVLMNAVDDVDHCHFAAPSIVRRGALSVAISTQGRAPALAKHLRQRLERELEAELATLTALLGEVREQTIELRPSLSFSEWARRWQAAIRRDLLGLIRRGRVDQARAQALEEIRGPVSDRPGRVAIVGAGPGAPDLITVRGRDLIERSDIVVYDRLVHPALVKDKDAVYVGKAPGEPHRDQEEINELLISLALKGRQVVRLKGGDPLVFGRGSEEAQALVRAGIDFEIVPAPTSAVAAPAYAGIPVTDRRLSSSMAVVTGHRINGSTDWRGLVEAVDTVVILMGVSRVSEIARKLVDAGLDSHTPAAVVENATLDSQRVFTAGISELPDVVKRENIQPPATIVVGRVVELSEELGWFGSSKERLASVT
ncbi:MAG: siroheme synthase CysG [Actinomycetota bacterium]|nr:siroheme synthase CysG [Actinomycetota bacterium]